VARFEAKKVTGLEWIGVVAGALALVVSFFSWQHLFGVDPALASALGTKTWYTAWGSGLSALLAVAFLVGAALFLLAPGFGVRLPGVPFVWLILAVAGLITIIVRWATLPDPDPGVLAAHNVKPENIDAGASIGLYLALAAAVISIAGAVLRVLQFLRPVTTTEYASPPTEPLGPMG
jgi:hypothetical protein